MRIAGVALAVVASVVLGVTGCGEDRKPSACDELYALIAKLEACTAVGKDAMAAKRAAVQKLIDAAKAQGNYEGVCRDEAWVLKKLYGWKAPDCLK